jgi:hypothetical protein
MLYRREQLECPDSAPLPHSEYCRTGRWALARSLRGLLEPDEPPEKASKETKQEESNEEVEDDTTTTYLAARVATIIRPSRWIDCPC